MTDLGSRGPMRVCHLGKYYPPAPGGIETHVQTLARAEASLGAQVQVACINHADRRGHDVTWSRYGATSSDVERDRAVRVCRLGRSAHFAKLDIVPDLRLLFRRLKEQPVDVIHLHTPNPTMLLAVAVLRPWAPLVITHHSDVVKQKVLYQAFAPFERLVYKRASGIITNSAAYVDGSDRLCRHRDKVHAVPMGLDLEPFVSPSLAAVRHAATLRARYGEALWLCVGRCVYYKGYDTALRALRDVPGTLVIVGEGPYKQHLMEAARELGVADRVVWWGYATFDELVGAYLAAKALWLPSNARSEAFGLVQIEAMASRCPVINTAIPHSGVAWVSKDGQTGLTVPVQEPAALAAAADRMLRDPDLRDRLAEAARRRAIDRFSETIMAIRTLEVYRQAIRRAAEQAKPAGRYLDLRFPEAEAAPHPSPQPAPPPAPRPVRERPVRERPGADAGEVMLPGGAFEAQSQWSR